MRKTIKKFAAGLLAMTMVFSLAGCGGSSSDKSGSSSGASSSSESDGKLVVGTSADYAPFEFIVLDDSGNQQYAGIDISFAEKVAEDMGKELEIVNMSFDNLMMSLQKGEIDVVISALEPNDERKQVADFSDAYYTDYPPMVLVKADKADEYTSKESLSGKTVGAQNATTKADIVNNDLEGATLLALGTVTDLVNNLEYDKCDAIILDGAVALQYADENDSMVVADIDLGETASYAVAVQKDDPSGLLESINKTIATVVADGSIDEWSKEADAISDEAVE